MSYSLRYGRSNCSWASCREGCTAQIYKCHQIRVTYTPRRGYNNNTMLEEIQESEWAYLTRTERHPDHDEGGGDVVEKVVEDTPLLINIKGCGYPPEVNCDLYAEMYQNFSAVSIINIYHDTSNTHSTSHSTQHNTTHTTQTVVTTHTTL